MARFATLADLGEVLDALGVPSTQLMWADHDPPPPPYVVVTPHETRIQYADGGVWHETRRYGVEIYAKERDVPLERRLASALKRAGIAYSSDVAVDEKGQVAITYFYVTLVEQEADNA